MSYKRIETKNYQDLMDKYNIKSLLAKIVSSFEYSLYDQTVFFANNLEYQFDEKIFLPIKEILYKIKEEDIKVFIFGDYDCDGICATTILCMLLDKINIKYGYYLPDRQSEGYGLNLLRLKQAYEKGYRALITVDNGVSCMEQINWAIEHKMQVIVTDHHTIPSNFKCDNFLHPALLPVDYQYLSGAAVVYLLSRYLNLDDDKMKILAMLSILSDVMPLKGINIKIVQEGIKLFNHHLYYNLETLEKLNYPVNETDLSFKIIPKINSLGRMSDKANVNIMVKYLLCNDKKTIDDYAVEINKVNKLRQLITTEQYNKIIPLINEQDKYNFIYTDNLHEGLLGLLAGKLTSTTGKPSFVMTTSSEEIKGSARSLKEDDLMALLDNFKGDFLKMGGHANACGFSIKEEKIPLFKEYLDKHSQCFSNDSLIQYIDVQQEELTKENIKEVFDYRPYGQSRILPLLHIKFSDLKDYKMLKNDHQLKWTTADNLQLISFENDGYNKYLNVNELEIIGELQENIFNGRINYQIMIKEIL